MFGIIAVDYVTAILFKSPAPISLSEYFPVTIVVRTDLLLLRNLNRSKLDSSLFLNSERYHLKHNVYVKQILQLRILSSEMQPYTFLFTMNDGFSHNGFEMLDHAIFICVK